MIYNLNDKAIDHKDGNPLNKDLSNLELVPSAKAKLAADLKEDPAGLCPARCDTERYWGHDYVKAEGEDDSVFAYCGRVEE